MLKWLKRLKSGKPLSLRGEVKRFRKTGASSYRYEEEALAVDAAELVADYTMVSYARAVTLWQQVRHLDRSGIQGSLVECGTWRGGSCGMMAMAHKHSGTPARTIHMFDSFEGLPQPDAERDGGKAVNYAEGNAASTLKSINKCIGPLDDNKRLMGDIIGYPAGLTVYHVGWFQDTVPSAAEGIGPIALLRLDGDWYHSTKVCLENLYHLVVPGGFVVIDDYGYWEGCRKAVDEFLAETGRQPYLNHIDNTGRYIIVT